MAHVAFPDERYNNVTYMHVNKVLILDLHRIIISLNLSICELTIMLGYDF